MSLALLRTCRAARFAFGAACSLIVAPAAARASAPLAGAVPTEFCDDTLARLGEVAGSLGYILEAGSSGFTGDRASSSLRCVCFAGQVAIELAEPDASVNVTFTRDRAVFGLEIAGQFSGVGSIHHAAMLDGTGDLPVGSLHFAADTTDVAARVEVDLAGEVLAADGDAALVNERYAPALAASAAWQDAYALTLALADMGELGLEVATTVAVPSPRWWGVKKSITNQAFTCGGAAITCTAAAAGFMPAAGSCVHGAGVCALSVACSIVSCLD
ncbi:hypothetical protein [Nannocystis bainbridge]|uniref:Uncharacterized protein n=1 Tax=Nannocystis bainbridge TaxID=2995303 RepID=A0ABT5E5T7_9BACT|nr:hypothetical protein [Nannocystis bainbridge]MDC0720303.1 hypothetical protein [Nannocystis bainbridge]